MWSPMFCGTPNPALKIQDSDSEPEFQTPTPGMCDILIVYFRTNGEKILVLLIKGARQYASKFFIATEIEKSQLGAGLRTRSRSLRQKEDSDSDSTPLHFRHCKELLILSPLM